MSQLGGQRAYEDRGKDRSPGESRHLIASARRLSVVEFAVHGFRSALCVWAGDSQSPNPSPARFGDAVT
jgi:hypothetical protein